MKRNILCTLSIAVMSVVVLGSCNKDKQPAVTISGNYTGSFEGTFMEDDTLTSEGYQVQVDALNDNKVKVTGNDFEQFEVLVTSNGLNVEPVSQSDPYLLDFIYIGEDSKLKFVYNKDGNEASFIGTK